MKRKTKALMLTRAKPGEGHSLDLFAFTSKAVFNR